MDVSTELIMQGKVAAERAVKADNEGNHAQALRLYRLAVKLLHEGCELEQDPDAIVTLRSKVASFKRRIADLELQEADASHAKAQAEAAAAAEVEADVSADGATWGTDPEGNDGVRLDDLLQEEEEEEEEEDGQGLPRAAWAEEPIARPAFPPAAPAPPSAQLTASQEGLQSLLRSKDRLEAQIQDARCRAETYTRGLEDARRSAYNAAAATATTASSSSRGDSHGYGRGGDDSSLASAASAADTDNTNIAIHGAPAAAPRVLALERLVKVLQRELIVVNTDLRVCLARNAALSQKLAESLGAEGPEAGAVSKAMSAADLFVGSMRERMVELETAQQEATVLSRSIATQLVTAKQRCIDLERELAAYGAVAGERGGGGSSALLSKDNSHESDACVGASGGPLMLLPVGDPAGASSSGLLSGASSITTDASASVSIMRRWKSQAQDRLAGKARAGAASSGKHSAGSRSPKTSASPKTGNSPKVDKADKDGSGGGLPIKPGQLRMHAAGRSSSISDVDAEFEDNSFEDTKGMLRDSYQLACGLTGNRSSSGGGRDARDAGGSEGPTEDILLMTAEDRDSKKRATPFSGKIAAKRENAVKARLEASVARGAEKARATGARAGPAGTGAGRERQERRCAEQKERAADRAAARERAAAHKIRASQLARNAALETATLLAAKAQVAADARAKLIKARVEAHKQRVSGSTLANRLSRSNPIGTPPRRPRTAVKVVVPSQPQRNTNNLSSSRGSGVMSSFGSRGVKSTGAAGSGSRGRGGGGGGGAGNRKCAASSSGRGAPSASLLAGIGVEHDFHMLNLSLDSADGGMEETLQLSGRRHSPR